jgi:hypothetical protein
MSEPPPSSDKPSLEIEAKWADLSQETKVVKGSSLYTIGIIWVSLIFLAIFWIAITFDPVLSRKF